MSDPGPRRKAARGANSPSTGRAAMHSIKSPKSRAVAKTGTPSKGRRTIFDGVVLPRFFSFASKGKAKPEAVVLNGAPHEEEENIAPEEGDPVLEGLDDSRLESSLASSNKGLHFGLSISQGAFLKVFLRERGCTIRPGS